LANSSPFLAPAPALVLGSAQFDLTSQVSGRTYRIFVFKPPNPPPPSGYPVIVLTDGNITFPMAATIDATFALGGGKAALVVGVGYATEDPVKLIRLRQRDLMPAASLSGTRPHFEPPFKPGDRERPGGAAEFYRFLVEELRPALAAAYPANAEDQTLYGHSRGGMFALNVLFNHPRSFRTFVASSPSIWWNGCSLLDDEPRFAAQVEAGEAAPRILISVGSKEKDPPDTLSRGLGYAQAANLASRPRMVENARDLAARLLQITGGPGYQACFHIFEDEDHLTVLPASIARALAFALAL
jgi:uncharacterized protein